MKYLVRHKVSLFYLIICNIITVFLSLKIALLIGDMIDVATNADLIKFRNLFFLFFATIIIENIFLIILSKVKFKILKLVMAELKNEVIRTVFYKNYGLVTKINTAEYITMINVNIDILENRFYLPIFNIAEAIIGFVFSIIVIFKLNYVIGCSLLVINILILILPNLFKDKLSNLKNNVTATIANLTDKVEDMFNGIFIIKQLNVENDAYHDLKDYVLQAENTKYKFYLFEMMISVFFGMVNSFAFFIPIVIGSIFLINNLITVGTTIALVQLTNNISNPINNLISSINQINSTKDIWNKINNLIAEHIIEDRAIEEINEFLSLEFKNFSFNINPQKQFVLQNINLTVLRGEKIAIVGPSGSGKSTLLKLILKPKEVYPDKIFINNKDLCLYDERNLNEYITYISQNGYTFNRTVEYNINLYGNNDHVDIIDYMNQFNLNLSLNQNAITLSGGEKQRVSLIRALLRKRELLILDEFTASLDNIMSEKIENYVLSLENQTVILVTHRMNAKVMSQFDRIFVLNEGSIVETGRFNELLKKKGFFYDLYNINQEI